MHRTARLLLPRQQRPYSTRSFEFSQLDKVQRYKYLCAAITPRPIAVISTTDKKGINNISMASFFAPVTSEPPTLTFSLTVRSDNTQKDTYNNICETGQFVVNCLTERFFTEVSIKSNLLFCYFPSLSFLIISRLIQLLKTSQQAWTSLV
eukprot:TRINITY_DN1572_c0_g1_i2.p1 TRINITY_DN1572_c0_g1~~TRINITY_DN1572_c0_g1_i2.p1  ORF type:complete len:157 (-),score=7.69 TRINITY_DN1572_c0_g1_i2:456-905(-)